MTGSSVSSRPPPANHDADPRHPLYGQVVVFTGALSILRADAWAAVASVGGVAQKDVTKHTDFLVIGDGFSGNSLEDFHTGKAQKAAARNAKGASIEVLTEGDFFGLIDDVATSGRAPGAA